MKKALFFSAIVALTLVGCKSSDEPQAMHQVTFCIPQLAVEIEPMNAPAVRK